MAIEVLPRPRSATVERPAEQRTGVVSDLRPAASTLPPAAKANAGLALLLALFGLASWAIDGWVTESMALYAVFGVAFAWLATVLRHESSAGLKVSLAASGWLAVTAAMSFPLSIGERDVACAVASGVLALAAGGVALLTYLRLRTATD